MAGKRNGNHRVTTEELIQELHRSVDGLAEDGANRADLKLLARPSGTTPKSRSSAPPASPPGPRRSFRPRNSGGRWPGGDGSSSRERGKGS
jgi:hypothetical protein